MNINETPKVKYSYGDNNPLLNGEGAQIPVFIGYTGNTSPNTSVLQFKNYTAATKAVEMKGLGEESDDNILLATIKDFFTEVRKRDLDDITVPYVYAIDLGAVPTTTKNDTTVRAVEANTWMEAIALAKTAIDAQVEVYCGFMNEDGVDVVVPILDSAVESEVKDSEKGNPRDIYFTIHDATDDDLKQYTDDSRTKYIQSSVVGLIEPTDFGKSVGRICCTPSYIEPGYLPFRSIESGEYNKRTAEECDELQSAGIIFINDEHAGSEITTRLNFAVSTAFANTNKPNDCLFHHRRNVNQLVREIYMVLFKQLKANETKTNIAFVQTDVNNIVKEKIRAETLMKGSECIVTESDTNPYTLSVQGSAIPVNSTVIIQFTMFIEEPNAIGGE